VDSIRREFFYPKNFAILFVITFQVGIVSGIWIRFFKRNLTANLKKMGLFSSRAMRESELSSTQTSLRLIQR